MATDKQIKSAIRDAEEWYGLILPYELVKRVLENNPRLLDGFSGDYGFDTEERSDFINSVLKQELNMNMEWPLNRDTPFQKELFFNTIKEACINTEIKLLF